MITPQNIVELEAHMDEFEEQQEILRQMAEAEIKAGDGVILTDPKTQAFYGKGVHTVESIAQNGEFYKIRLWHGKRSISVCACEIKKFEKEDIAVSDIYKAVNTLPDEVITESKLTGALFFTYGMKLEIAREIAEEYLNYVI